MDRFRPLDPDFDAIPARVVECVPAELAREENVMPVALRRGVLVMAVDRPADFDLIDKLQFILGTCGMRIEPIAAPPDAIRAAVARYYGTTDA